jgi:mannose-1-phosphate guanylyltransferase
MFPVANRPLLDWIVQRLAQSGVGTIILAVNYMADVISRYFGRSRYGSRIIYSREAKPLGTGGPIKNAERFLGNDSKPFFVLNGDILSNINYNELLQSHISRKAKATIALCEVENPSRFGVAALNDKNQILRFIEKPKLEEAPSRLINAGVYVLDPTVLTLIPRDRRVSIEREIFPVLAENKELYGYRFDGLWTDIGKPEDYLLANRKMLEIMASSNSLSKINNANMVPPVAIGKNVIVEQDAVVGPYVSIGEGAVIKRGARVENSVLLPGVWVDYSASIRNSIIGEKVVIGRWVKVENGCMIGDYAIIEDNVTLTANVKVCPYKEVSESILQPSTVM